MSAKAIILALAAACSAAADSFNESASTLDTGGAATGKAPPARAAIKAGGATAKPKAKGKKAETIDLESLKEKLVSYIKSPEGGRDKAVAALTRFGIGKLADLDEDRFAEFNEFIDQCISGEVDPEAASEGEDDDLLA